MRAELTITDDGAGVQLNAIYHGGFNVHSHAHQHMNLLITYMNKLAVPQGEATIEHVEVPVVRPQPSAGMTQGQSIAELLADARKAPETMECPPFLRSV
mgnify:CR=1 FL=1